MPVVEKAAVLAVLMDRKTQEEIHEIVSQHRLKVEKPTILECLLAEFVGTFFLVLTVGVSVVGGGGMAPVAIGLVLGIQIYTFGAISGGLFNPAVTLAVLLSGRGQIKPLKALLYMVVQFLGAIVAGLMAFAGTGKTFFFEYPMNWGTSFELEMFFTMALCMTVLTAGTSNDAPNQYFGFAIGMTVTGGALACGGFDQGSFNPAVTLGINIANSANSAATGGPMPGSWALFLLVPMLGAVMAAAVFRGTRSNEYKSRAEASVAGANGAV